ncbi:hypothetical protein [Methylotenera sp.]|uniref:hypothetical protein n=1 Tax=Methylotenera sp. TaxID=2051956 RepID=UPI002EDB2B1A
MTLLVLLMPMQAISMQMAMNQANSVESGHHTAMLSEQNSQQSAAMSDHCKMQMHHGKQTQQKPAYCLGSTCSVICAGLVLAMPLFTLATSPTVNDFTSFIAPNFHSQVPDSLERPPRTFS